MVDSIALFLGAGASRAFDYPTTPELLKILDREYPKELKDTINTISAAESVEDIEHVLLFIDAVLSLDSAPHVSDVLSKSPPDMRIMGSKISWPAYVDRMSALKRNIISSLYSAYEYKENKREEINVYYNHFFEALFNEMSDNTLDIFTTNYDSVIEEYVLKSQYKLINGFSEDRDGRYWEPKRLYENYPDEKSVKLIKLHGSLNWRLTQDDRIEWVKVEEERTRSQRYKENVLIYPTQSILMNQEPYATIFQYFTKRVKDVETIIVIGCSFRDDYINTILLNAMLGGELMKFITVSRHTSDRLQNSFGQSIDISMESLNKELIIIPIDAEFGKEETINKIYGSIIGI